MELLDTNVAVAESVASFQGKKQMVEKSVTKPRAAKPVERTVVAGPIWMDTEEFRKQRGESQSVFWNRFGVTQSAGSRYEVDSRKTPVPVLMLLIAFAMGTLSEDELNRLQLASNEVNKERQRESEEDA